MRVVENHDLSSRWGPSMGGLALRYRLQHQYKHVSLNIQARKQKRRTEMTGYDIATGRRSGEGDCDWLDGFTNQCLAPSGSLCLRRRKHYAKIAVTIEPDICRNRRSGEDRRERQAVYIKAGNCTVKEVKVRAYLCHDRRKSTGRRKEDG